MRLRRSLQVAGMVVAVAAIVVPTVESADWWWLDHKQGRYPVKTLKKHGEPSLNEFTFTTAGNKKIGPCEKEGNYTFSAKLYSKFGGMGEGELSEPTSSAKECKTTIGECELKKFKPSSGAKYGLTLKEDEWEEYEVQVSNFKFDVELVGNCENFAPKIFTAEGTVSGEWIDYDFETGLGPEIKFQGPKVKVGGTELSAYGNIGFGTKLVAAEEPKGFSPAKSPATLKGTQLDTFSVTRGMYPVECEAATLVGTAAKGAHEVTVTPTFSNCNWSWGPVTIKMNSCKFRLHLESELVDAVEEKYRYTAPTDLVCPEAAAQIDIFMGEGEHLANKPLCRFTLGEAGNQERERVELTNKGDLSSEEKGWIEGRVELEGLTSKRTVGGQFICGAENDTEGTVTGMYKVVGETEAKEENGIGVFP